MLVVISGGSQGVGAALAEDYVRNCHSVVIVARTESKLAAKVAELERLITKPDQPESGETTGSTQGNHAAKGDAVLTERLAPPTSSGTSETAFDPDTSTPAEPKQSVSYIAADVSVPAECTRVFDEIGQIPDIVMCCAGAANPGLFLEQRPENFALSLQTIYHTALYFSHAALRVMASAPDKFDRRRTLVYFSSTLAVFPLIGYSTYAPAKAAIRALSDIVRQESLTHNIRVAHVLPGNMDTEGFENEERTKPAITKKIEGASAPASPSVVAAHIVRKLNSGNDTIFTDNISWVVGSGMLGTSPRYGFGILQGIVGIFMAIFGSVVAWTINRDIITDGKQNRERGG